MEKCVLERIADVIIIFSNRYWEKCSICKPQNFDTMSQEEKDNYRKFVNEKLMSMLQDPSEILFSWAWKERFYPDQTFEDWLYEKVSFVPIDFSKNTLCKIIFSKFIR